MKYIYKVLVTILICLISSVVLSESWSVGKTKAYQACRSTCIEDAQKLGKIGYFSSKIKCNCFCKGSFNDITTKEFNFFITNNVFPKSFQIKRKKLFNKCFS